MPVSAILLISFFALLIFNVPVGYSLGCSALITILLAMGSADGNYCAEIFCYL